MAASNISQAETIEKIKYGDMESWVTRNIKESAILGGNTRTVYAIGPTKTITGVEAYVPAPGNPWASSNVYANVMGIVKTSNAVDPGDHPGKGKCVVMKTKIEHCKAIGIININVLVSGSIFLGQMMEPIKSTSNPYSKMNMGIPYTKRPQYLQFDYSLIHPNTGILTHADGKKTKTVKGNDNAEVFVLLQKRWEDKDGNLYAQRVGTARERYDKSTNGWIEGHRIKINYGDITGTPGYKDYMGLIPKERSYYGINSKGKLVPVVETGWAPADAQPTHLLLMASSGCGSAYIGTVGMEFSVDNLAFVL